MPLTIDSFNDSSSFDDSSSFNDSTNVGTTERWVSVLGGAVLVVVGLRRRRWRGWLVPLGSSLMMRGVTGRCAVNRALGRNTARRPRGRGRAASVRSGAGIKVERRIIIDRSPGDLYGFWRNLENLPRFMDHLESVTVGDDRQSRWIAKGPAGTRVEWDAEIVNDVRDHLIAWRSLPEADVNHAGSVQFRPLADARATEVRVVLSYEPPAGRVGATVAKLFGEEPSQQIEEDLRRFKQVMESGEFSAADRR